MNNRRAIAVAALVVIAIGFIVVLTLRSFTAQERVPVHADVSATAAPAAPLQAETEASSGRVSEPPPPWLQPGAPAVPDPSATGNTAEDALRARQMRHLQESMRGVVAAASQRSAETTQHLREALDTLEAMNDPAVTSQINLDAVRHNLEISVRMQTLAKQLQQIAAQPQSPQRQQHLDATVAELRTLQAQLRADVRAPGSTLPAPIAASTPIRGTAD